jgi:hypothetical protein
VLADLIRAWPAAAAAGVLPGYFWARVLRPASGLGERLAFSTAISMAAVPPVAVLLARVAGAGVALWVALAAVLIVLGSGAAVLWLKGGATGPAGPVLPRPARVRDPLTLALIAVALLLALASTLRPHATGWLPVIAAAGAFVAGAYAAWRPPTGEPDPTPAAHAATEPPTAGSATADSATTAELPTAEPPTADSTTADSAATGPATAGGGTAPAGPAPAAAATAGASPPVTPATSRSRPGTQLGALAVVLALTAFRAYEGVIRFDWPYLPGGDQFSHAVMTQQMLAHGSYPAYLVYPPGFSTLTAVICRFSGLSPLALFPVLAPLLVVVAALGAYALASRLWGGWYGIAAAVLSGLVLTGAFNGFAQGRYPDLVSAYFLLVMTVAALVSFYQSPTLRSGVLAVVVGASAMFYHSVAALYLAVLMALVAVVGLPYLLYQGRRREAGALTLTLAGVAVLAGGYAVYVYELSKVSGGHAATSTAVSIALGSQSPLGPPHLLTELTPPVVWLGLFGAAALAVGLRHRASPARVLAAVTLLGWCVLMYLGSRTSLDGFPQRFERDLGAPLTVTGALAIGLIAKSLLAWRPGGKAVTALTATAAAGVALILLGFQAGHNLRSENHKGQEMLTPAVAAAGRWLAAHNTGGNIISTPYLNPGISNRAVLAMGGYTGLQSYSPRRIAHPRSLPPAGKQPLLDSRTVLLRPASCQALRVISRDDVRYVFLYKQGTGADLAAFHAAPARYRRVFENRTVVIYAPARTGSCG